MNIGIEKRLLSRELVTEEQVKRMYASKNKESQGMHQLKSNGIFPITFHNPKFTYLNILGLYSLFSGSIGLYGGIGVGAIIAREGSQFGNIADRLSSELGINLKEKKEEANHDTTYAFSNNAGAYIRVLKQLGFMTPGLEKGIQRHTKAREGYVLPEYLSKIINNYDILSIAQRICIDKYIRDMLSVLLDTKGRIDAKTSLKVALPNQPSRVKAKRLSELIVKAMNIIYPEAEISNDNVRTLELDRNKKSLFGSTVTILLKQLIHFPRSGSHRPISIQTSLEPHFSFTNKGAIWVRS